MWPLAPVPAGLVCERRVIPAADGRRGWTGRRDRELQRRVTVASGSLVDPAHRPRPVPRRPGTCSLPPLSNYRARLRLLHRLNPPGL